jgi:hypothetical protein
MVGELVTFRASINYAGCTSMEVGIRTEAEGIRTGARRHTNSCLFHNGGRGCGWQANCRAAIQSSDRDRAATLASRRNKAKPATGIGDTIQGGRKNINLTMNFKK